MHYVEIDLEPCPFCQETNLGFSDKTTTIDRKRKRHVAMYCKDCHCYGPRLIVPEVGYANRDGKKEAWDLAADAWNSRKYKPNRLSIYIIGGKLND